MAGTSRSSTRTSSRGAPIDVSTAEVMDSISARSSWRFGTSGHQSDLDDGISILPQLSRQTQEEPLGGGEDQPVDQDDTITMKMAR